MDPLQYENTHIHQSQSQAPQPTEQTLEEHFLSHQDQFTNGGFTQYYDSFHSHIVDDAFIALSKDSAILLNSGIFDVLILYKPRGSKGIWQRVDHGDKLPVKEGKGKRLKLQFGLPSAASENLIIENNLQIQLLESQFSPSHALQVDPDFSGFLLESIKTFESFIEVGVKLRKIGGQLQFFLQIPTTADILFGKSVEFSAYKDG